ncbi:MAG: SDR family oxidoreductase [Deltaproteobacteria bacterium]|nr:SDR family oxidoreductase [Deltaproteobacteria bacterium]
MDKRLNGKVAIVIGAGQTPGDTIGNGRAISLLFARHGAKVLLYGCIDILVNNVGIGAGDNTVPKLDPEAWDNIFNANLKGIFLTCKHVIPVMESHGDGSIISISSAAAVCAVGMTAYKVSKAGVNALTHQMAMKYAKKGIRVNAIMPGLMNTPMAIEGISGATGKNKEELIRFRNDLVPLKGGMGDAWDTA